MTYDPDIHNRHSIRLKGYDYSFAGAYSVTICVNGRESLFGDVTEGEMRLTDGGWIVERGWSALPERFPNVELDEWIIMPNHFHGIIIIHDTVGAPLAAPNTSPNTSVATDNMNQGVLNQGAASGAPTVGEIIRAFKSISAVAVNRILNRQGVPVWQRNYYERVLRNEAELDAARRYILDNPMKWGEDRENPVNAPDPANMPSP